MRVAVSPVSQVVLWGGCRCILASMLGLVWVVLWVDIWDVPVKGPSV